MAFSPLPDTSTQDGAFNIALSARSHAEGRTTCAETVQASRNSAVNRDADFFMADDSL